MKKTGTFEYVDLEFIISDDRIFSDEFYTNERELQIRNRRKIWKLYRFKRKKKYFE